ncbi:MAG: DUF5615 family PIN-like protein [Chloroflexi bacterium]|nr:DUF5615 family PIN-like protein [Chloroflexota bacterium]
MRILLDENFNNDILRGLLRRKPYIDVVRVQDIEEIAGADDPTVLAWAARESRVLFTHDISTITAYAIERVETGKAMPGVFGVGQELPVGQAIEEMLTLLECSQENEWEGLVLYLPLK